MRCLLVGSGGMIPLPDRFLNSVLVQLEGRGYLFDCGEGTQIAMQRWHAGFRHIALLAITHLHGDHVLGIPGFLMARANAGSDEPLAIVGPPGIQRFVENVTRDVAFVPPYELCFTEIDPAETPPLAKRGALVPVHEDDLCRLEAAPVEHNAMCLGYRISEHPRPGKFDPEKARRLGVPEGPMWRRLQDGELVTLEDGRTIAPERIVGPPRPGRVCAFVTDTLPAPGVHRLLEGADIAFLEGMFLEQDMEAAGTRAHLSVRAAAKIAKARGVRRTVLMHLSPRYQAVELERLEAEAREENEAAEVGKEGQWYEVGVR